MKNSWREECGVFGIWNHPDASRMTYLGLFALQHRGQESCGIVTLENSRHIHHKALGLVADAFTEPVINRLKGSCAVGHVRYATTGENLLTNAQPITAALQGGAIAIAHNGNITNAAKLKTELQGQGAIFQGSNDTEVITHLLARAPAPRFEDKLISALEKLEGAYSLVILTENQLIAARDPQGFRPLSFGYLPGGIPVFASESCAFDLIGAKFERDIKPGEVLVIEGAPGSIQIREHVIPFSPLKPKRLAQCIFEHVYFARPDSVVFGTGVYQSRKRLGRLLAQEKPVSHADIVVPVPDSGVAAALGYSEESGIPFEMGIIRNHYVGRTFIEPRESIRSFGVKVKLNPMTALLSGKSVVVIDDSIVRGTTSKKIIGLIREAGAKEVHLRIAAPPTTGPCYYGVDTPSREQLIASHKTEKEIGEFVGADSLGYLSVAALFKALSSDETKYCAACFDGRYP